MKWKRRPAEFLPEKTFLIIKDDLDSLTETVELNRRKKTKSAPDTGTWPPKIKKSCPYAPIERPKTANLEKPIVLDPNLVNKLDMSLLSKELLCDSMTRIQHDMQKLSSGSMSSRCHRRVPSSEKHSSISNIIDIKTLVTRQKRRSFEQITVEQISSIDKSNTDYQNMKKQLSSSTTFNISDNNINNKKRMNIENKRLDDNNNNSNSNSNNRNGTLRTTLSTLRTIKSSSSRPAEIDVFTGSTKNTAPEPCKTCGRPDQPERFHSHPKGVVPIKISSKDLSNGKTKETIRKTIQKPVALNFRSEKKLNNNKDTKIKDDEKIDKLNDNEKINNKNLLDNKKGPKSVTCYICAREFGTASFPIHEPKCMQRWERENNDLPISQRRLAPQRPIVPLNHQDWNKAAWELSQTQLVPCWKCGRTFLPDRLPVHQKSCKASPKSTTPPKSDKSESLERLENTNNNQLIGLRTICCKVCGRNFGSRSINIHEPQCLKRWQIENERKKDISKWEKNSTTPPRSPSLTTNSSTDILKSRITTCYICGRDFGSASIEIHEPQCLKKWQIENAKLPVSQRRQEPQKPDIIFKNSPTSSSSSSSSSKHVIDWPATTEARWKSHLGQLVPCKKCKRTFNPDRVTIHEVNCKGI